MSTETPTESPAQEAIQHIKAVSNMMRAAKDEKTAQTVCSLNWTLLEGAAREIEAELARARETVRKLNRRAQEAEGIIAKAGLVENRPQGAHGRSFGRALANYAATKYKEEADELRAKLQELTAVAAGGAR